MSEKKKKDDMMWGCLIVPFVLVFILVSLDKGCSAGFDATGKSLGYAFKFIFGILFFSLLAYLFWKIFIDTNK